MNELKFLINRKVWQSLWAYITTGDMFEGYCEEFENNTFQIKPYSWNEEYWDNKYHFWHKPSGFKLQWYKYPLRGASCNMQITDEQFVDILYDCINSLEEGKKCKLLHDVDKWWEIQDKK